MTDRGLNVNRLAIIFISTLLFATPVAAQCLSQSEARQAVASGQAASLGSVAGQAGGEILRADLCREGGRYVYRLQVSKGGQVQTVVVNASR